MGKEPATPRLSQGDIGTLRILWELGEVSLSEAHRAMEERGIELGYTTVQTRLERLVQKGVVAKSDTRPAKYSAMISPEEVSGSLLHLLLERVAGPVPLMAQLLQDPSLTTDDLDELKRLVAEAEASIRHKGSGG